MSDNKFVGYVCYEGKEITDDGQKMAEKYWEFDRETRSFVYSIKALASEFNVGQYEIPVLIKHHYKFASNMPQHICDMCGLRQIFSSKTQFLSLLDAEGHRCEQCKISFAEKLERRHLDQWRQFEARHLKGSYHVGYFSLVEKIFLFSFWKNINIIPHNYWFSVNEMNTVTGNVDFDLDIMYGLVEKGIIYHVIDFTGDIDLCSMLGIDSVSGINNVFVLKSSDKYGDHDVLMSGLYDSIVACKASYDDLVEIQHTVESVRLSDIYKLVDYVAEGYKISVPKNAKLEGLLRFMGKKYTLMQCAYLLYKEARDVAAFLYSKPDINWYCRANLFSKFLERFLSTIEIKEYDVYSYDTLPQIVESSKFECMVSDMYFDELNWNSMSTKTITEKWISSLTVTDA